MRKNVLWFLVLISGLLPLVTLAHNPRFVMDKIITLQKPQEIKNPEVSQVFYGELKGKDEYYHFQLKQPAKILIGLLVPLDEENFPSAEVGGKLGQTYRLVGGYNKVFFEEFGGDYYLQGPEQIFNLVADDYLIKVANASSTGKYALVIGQEENFSPPEIINTYLVSPLIKSDFFSRPIWSNFFNLIGILLVIISLVYFSLKHTRQSRYILYTGLIIFVLSSLMIVFNNPFSLLGWLKILLAIGAIILSLIASLKHLNDKKNYLNIQYALWLLIIFISVLMM